MSKFALTALFKADSSDFVAGTEKSQKAGAKFSGFLKGALIGALVAAGAALVKFASDSVKKFMEFEKKMAEVFTLIPNASKKMRTELTEGAKEISKAFGTDLVDNVQAMYNALSAGVPKENVVDFLKTASTAAKGGVTDLNTAVGAITTVMNSYGKSAEEAGDISDSLFVAVKGGVTTFGELGSEIGKVTPIASALGMEFSDVTAMFADLTAKLGAGKTAEAGTQLKAMLAELSKETGIASKNFKEFTGIAFTDFIKNGGSVKDALLALQRAADQNGKSMIDMFGSIQAGQAALNLAKDGAQGLTQKLEDQKTRAGATKDAHDEMAKTFDNQVAKAMQRVNVMIVDLGKSFKSLGGGGGGIIDTLLSLFENLVGYFKNATKDGDALSGVFEIMQGAVNKVVKVIAVLTNSFRLLMNQLNLIMAGLGSFSDIMDAVFSPISDIIDGVIDAVGTLATAMADPLNPSSWSKAKDEIGKIIDEVGQKFEDYPKTVGKAMDKANADLNDAWDDYKKTNTDAMKEIGDILKEEGNWAFLDPDKVLADNMKNATAEAMKIAEENEKIRKIEEKRAEVQAKQAELLQKAIDNQAKMKEKKEQILNLEKQQKAKAEEINGLLKAQEQLNGKIKQRRAEIKKIIQEEATLHNDALGILDKLAQKTNLRARDERRIAELKDMIAKKAQLANDATDDGIAKLKAHRDALLLIKETEIERAMKVKGLTREQAEEFVKSSKVIQQIDKGIAGTNNRLKKAIEHQKGFNKKVPEAKVAINGVMVGAEKLAGKIKNAKAEQQNLTAKTKEAKQGFADMGAEATTIQENLRDVAQELDSVKFGADDLKIDAEGAKQIPTEMEKAKDIMEEINQKAEENGLVKLANMGSIDVNTSSPIPVEVKDLKFDKDALKKVADGSKKLLKPANQTANSLKSIDKTLKGYFVNQ